MTSCTLLLVDLAPGPYRRVVLILSFVIFV